MGNEVSRRLPVILVPIIKCVDDPDPRVRYYATESLYNVAKVARFNMLDHFNSIFDVLCKLFADVDIEVKHGAQVLDHYLKDLVNDNEGFAVDSFIPLLQKYLKISNPYIRQLLLGWITALDTVPDIDMVKRLPDFLDGVYNMLSDNNKEIRESADKCLAEFLLEVKETDNVDVLPTVPILVNQCQSIHKSNRLTALTWINEFILLVHDKLVSKIADLVGAVMHCLSDEDSEIKKIAEGNNILLRELIKKTNESFTESPIIDIAIEQLGNFENENARLGNIYIYHYFFYYIIIIIK